jgi:DNA replication protein DnaC
VGYRRENVPYGHPNFGKALECECKLAEQKKRLQQRLVADSGILSLALFETASFDSFDQSLPGVFDAHYHASLFAHDPSGWLILEGPYGCGKTHLAVAIAKARINAGDTIIVQTVPDLLDHLRSAFAPNSAQNYSELFETMRNVDLLILDDYGAQSDTPWALEKLFQLLNYRYNKALATVITSNDLKSGDARLYSRMHDKRLVRKIDMEQARDYRVYGDEE